MGPTAIEPELSRVFVISDVHVGAGELDDFLPVFEQKLVSFIDMLGRLAEPVHLVINGDFFDFATAAPWKDRELESTTSDGLPLCFTEVQSCLKLEQIIVSHSAVFDALTSLLATKSNNQITMLPGNHDADLFWPLVRQRISERLSQGTSSPVAVDRFTFVLERQLVLERAGERYWIEHGHQHDPPNSFFPGGVERWSAAEPPIFRDKKQEWRLYECPGTLGLVRYMNKWRPTYRAISYLKPYSKVVLALATQSAFKEPGRPLMVLKHLGAYLGWRVDLQTTLSSCNVVKACDQALLALVNSLSAEEEAELKSQFAAGGLAIHSPLRTYVQTPLNRKAIFDQLARESTGNIERPAFKASQPTLGFLKGSWLDDAETKALLKMARELISDQRADYVLTGHTHSPCQMLQGRFTNGGCWTPNQAVNTKKDAAAIIFNNEPVAYRLSYIEVWVSGPPRLRCFGKGTIRV